MKLRKHIWLASSLLVAITLNACNLGATPAPTQDVAAIQSTALAQVLSTVSAQQTQTAAAIPPTALSTDTLIPTITLQATFGPVVGIGTQLPGLTPLAIATVTPGVIATTSTKNGCNDALYVGEYPHYTDATHYLEVNIGETVEQFFTFKNTGTCKWDEGFGFIFQPEYSSPEITGNTIILPKNKESDYTAVGNSISYKGIIKAPKIAGDYAAFWKLRADDATIFGPLVSLYIRVRKP